MEAPLQEIGAEGLPGPAGDQTFPRVSIIIPAHNEERSLVFLLDSLSRLVFPKSRLEIVVVDHESTDRTAEIAARLGARVILHRGGTIASVRNAGARTASGTLLAFVDADCTVAPDWLTCALIHFDDPRVGAVGSFHEIPLEPLTLVRRVLHLYTKALPEKGPAHWLPSGNFIVHRDVFWASGGFDETMATCEDVDLCVRIARTHFLVNDRRIRCLHHGEVRTLGELFRKELWRGRDNFVGIFRHGVSLRELPSVMLPLFFVVAVGLMLTSPLLGPLSGWGTAGFLVGSAAAALLPPLAVAGVICARAREVRHFPAAVLVAGCYLAARGLAPMRAWRNF